MRSPALLEALRLIREQGITRYRASKMTGADQSAILRALRLDGRPVCKCCGQVIKKT